MHVMVPEDQTGVGTTHAGNRYDHFLISPDMVNEEAVRCKIVTYSGSDLKRAKKTSDHLPVLALFNADDQNRDRP
jgi:exonuclease III